MRQEHSTPEALLASIKSVPHWRVVFYPRKFEAQRVARGRELLEMVRKHKVALRGWDYPHIDTKGQTQVLRDSATSWTEFMHSREVWRMFRSGQFVHIFGLLEDDPEFAEQLKRRSWSSGAGTAFMSVENVIYVMSEVYEFASRLASEGLYDSGIHFHIELYGAKGRRLSIFDVKRILHNSYIAEEDTIVLEYNIAVEDLRGRAPELAIQAATDLFADFGATFSADVIRDIQRGLRGYGI